MPLDSPRTPTSGEYILVRDNDAHWYVIPDSRFDEWDAVLQAEDFLPEWAIEVGGAPSLIKFREWRRG